MNVEDLPRRIWHFGKVQIKINQVETVDRRPGAVNGFVAAVASVLQNPQFLLEYFEKVYLQTLTKSFKLSYFKILGNDFVISILWCDVLKVKDRSRRCESPKRMMWIL